MSKSGGKDSKSRYGNVKAAIMGGGGKTYYTLEHGLCWLHLDEETCLTGANSEFILTFMSY